MNSNTHIALCDIQMFAHIPNLIYLAPASKEEYMPTYSPFVAKILSNCTLSFLCQPDFIAYQNVERPKHVLRMREKGTLLFAWTSRVPDVDQAQNDAVIFENYRPSLLF